MSIKTGDKTKKNAVFCTKYTFITINSSSSIPTSTMNWINIKNTEQITAIATQSKTTPCLIFKHSMTCNMSAMAKFRLEEDWNFNENELIPYFVDILQFKKVSNEISDYFQEYHQSPQILIIKDGYCIYEESHLDISVEDIQENLTDGF